MMTADMHNECESGRIVTADIGVFFLYADDGNVLKDVV